MTVQSVSFYSDRIGDLIKKDNRPLVVKRFEKCHFSLSMYFQCRLKSMTLFGHKLSISLSLYCFMSLSFPLSLSNFNLSIRGSYSIPGLFFILPFQYN